MLRQLYNVLYENNIACDFVNTSSKNIEDYSLIIVPPLYAVADRLLERLNTYTLNGGHLLYAFKAGFANENVQIRHSRMPGIIEKACGIYYQQFTNINRMAFAGNPFSVKENENYGSDWAELLIPETAKVLARYDHPYWGKYAAITENKYGKGLVTYMGTLPSKPVLQKLLKRVVDEAGLTTVDQQLSFPIITKSGANQYGKNVHYYFNYSGQPVKLEYPYHLATDLMTNSIIQPNQLIELKAWDFIVLEESQ